MITLNKELGVGFGNIYTRLGNKALSKNDGSMVGGLIGNQRTFCNLPKTDGKQFWHAAINDEVRCKGIVNSSELSSGRPRTRLERTCVCSMLAYESTYKLTSFSNVLPQGQSWLLHSFRGS